MGTKMLIYDDLCEKMVLGALLTCPDTIYSVGEELNQAHFYDQRNKAVFNAICSVSQRGDTVDIVSVFAELNRHPDLGVDAVYLTECSSSVATSTTFHQHCDRLRQLAKRRTGYEWGWRLMAAASNELEDFDQLVKSATEALNSMDESPQTTVKSIKQNLEELNIIVNDNASGLRKNGIPTPFEKLNSKGGLQLTDLVVVAAEFSQGKTSFALDLVTCASKNGYPISVYSTEMMGTQLAARILAAESGLSSRTIMQQPLNQEQFARYDQGVGKITELPIYTDDSSTQSVERIIRSIRTLTRKKGVKVAVVDYLQVLQTNEKTLAKTEEQFFGETARRLKNLAKELNICILLLSQISRSKDTTEPSLSRVRGSGQIVEAADVVLLIYRPEFYGKGYTGEHANVDAKGTALIRIAKGRNIGTGDFICGFDAPTTHFFELPAIPMLSPEKVNNKDPF